jgi:VanZ family protein
LRLLLDERAKRLLFRLWCAGWLVVLVVSLRPLQHLPFGVPDKLAHLATYAAMSAGLAGFCHDARAVLRWAGLAALIGGAVELGQRLVPMRTPELGDFLANTAGVGLGAVLALLWLALVIRPLSRRPPAKAMAQQAGRLAS